MMWVYKILLCMTFLAHGSKCDYEDEKVWRWECEEKKCVKKRFHDRPEGQPPLSLEACKMFCNEYGVLWPHPTGDFDIGNFLSKINIDYIEFITVNKGENDDLVEAAKERFRKLVLLTIPKGAKPFISGKALQISLDVKYPDIREITLDTDESYTIRIWGSSNPMNVTVTANNFFGLRHGLETLSQLMLYDDIRRHVMMVRDVAIDDGPRHKYRGILLDTARNYYSVDSIKATIDAMAAVKLNTFHWHITDSQSFPFVSERRPNLTKLGAINPNKVYTKEAMREVVRYGLERGVRVLPEFDAPAHVGEGWQDTNLTVCFKAEPWIKYCVEPPCGQLNPIKDELYEYLEDIYTEMAEVFQPDIFHMGGDEVSEACWNSSAEIQEFMINKTWDIRNKNNFLKLWDYFQGRAQERVYKAFGKRLPIIVWTSTMTNFENIEKYLNKEDYIIQVWTTGNDPQVMGLLEKGYNLIISNYDALYFDCGYGAWVGSGNNWCSPYIGWQKVYDNSLILMGMQYTGQILGGEAALWSEQSDSSTLDGRLWPRAAALAERLWSEPTSSWQDAEFRMLHMRERLVRMGIQADSIQPEWCYQNEGYCYA